MVKLTVCVFLGCMALFLVASSMHMSLTYDELDHLTYGVKVLQSDPSRAELSEDSKMPFSAFNALVYCLARSVGSPDNSPQGSAGAVSVPIAAARMVTMFFALCLGLLIFLWSRQLYGTSAGLVSLFLYSFSPNIIAHGRLITTDLYAALMVTLSLYSFWRLLTLGGRQRAVLSAAALGMSQLAKYTCVWLYPIFLVIVLLKYGRCLMSCLVRRDIRSLSRYARTGMGYIVLFLAVSVVIINVGFVGKGTGTPLSGYVFQSGVLKAIQSVPFLKDLPLPLPYPYLQGFDLVNFHQDNGIGFGNIYLLGKLKIPDAHSSGFNGYYLYCLLFKEPLAIILLMLCALGAYVGRKNYKNFFRRELFLAVPCAFFFVYFNFFFKAQIGIRSFLVVLPFVYIFCGSLFEKGTHFSVKAKVSFAALFVALSISTVSYFPHYISYFNEIVSDRTQAYKLLADSNIDWGQSVWYLNEYTKAHPEVIVDPGMAVSGKVVVPVNALVGVFDPERYKWLREGFEPVSTIAYSYLVYEVPSGRVKIIPGNGKM